MVLTKPVYFAFLIMHNYMLSYFLSFVFHIVFLSEQTYKPFSDRKPSVLVDH